MVAAVHVPKVIKESLTIIDGCTSLPVGAGLNPPRFLSLK